MTSPREELGRIGSFLDHDLDYDRILRAGLGRLSESNSSFREEGPQQINPLARWKQRLTPTEVAAIESTVGECLQENGYELSSPATERPSSFRHLLMRRLYPAFLDTKQWLKLHTPLGRFVELSYLELDDEPLRKAESTGR